MAVAFTPEQQRVIDIRNHNILVSAAAGSGKTAVLTERIVQKVCDEENPVDIDRMLVVTFTNAAASEMRERIAQKLSERLALHPDSEQIQRQATLLHNAQITTIDSFCLFLLRNHFNEIGLDPAFRIADEGEIRLLQQEVLGELLEERFASKDPDFTDCVEYFCAGGKESTLEKAILDISRFASAFPWPAQWLMERKQDYDADTPEKIDNSSYGLFLLQHLSCMLEGMTDKLEQVRKLCEEPDGPYMYGELVDQELEQLQKLADCKSLGEFAVRLPAVSFGRLPGKKDDSVSAEKRELAGRLRSEVKKSIQELCGRLFASSLEVCARQNTQIRKPVSTLIDLVLEFDERMSRRKQEKKVIDFSDAEHFALDILLTNEDGEIKPSPVALEYRQHFEEILTDEYQDSNLVQEYLLSAVSGEEEGHYNRFMVGDVKQSIYRFRLARPELFLEKYHHYSGEGVVPDNEAKSHDGDSPYIRIDLAKNFRSRIEVVDSVNAVFSRLMSDKVGGITYDDRAALYPGAQYPENDQNETELLLVDKGAASAGSTDRELEARAVAARIKELRTDLYVTDRVSKKLRKANYSDMVILLRTNSGWDEVFKSVLEEEGIPVCVTTKSGYFGATEVQELLQVLRVLDNPCQDIPLFGVMKSVFGGFDEEEIALIRSRSQKGLLYESVKQFFAESEESPLKEKVGQFLKMLGKYRRFTVYMSVRELLTAIVTDFDYLNYVTALPAGSKRRANVEMLFTRASDFEKTSYFGLFHFVRYIEQLEKYDVDFGEAEVLDETADVVRIMSIHKSKGLEFPITFVSGLGKGFNLQDVNQSLVLDMDLGLGTDYVNPKRRIRNRSLRRLALAGKLRKETLAEELRVLYVAMTRAREKLILTGSLKNAAGLVEECRETAVEQLSYLQFFESKSYLDFLLPILGNTGIRVSVFGEEHLTAKEVREQLAMKERRCRLHQESLAVDEEALEKLQARLQAEYAYENLAQLYTKTTVSELKIAAMADRDEEAYHVFEEKEIQPYIPGFRQKEEKTSGTVRGNAYHRVMELLDFRGFSKELDAIPEDYGEYLHFLKQIGITSLLQEMLQKATDSGRLKTEYRDAVKEEKIIHFLETELAHRMWKAELSSRLFREQPFVIGINASRLGDQYPDSEQVLIQGIIDAFFEEEDGLVLLDYKTDAVTDMKMLWDRYETQLQYYEEALTRLRNKPVKERYLYSFRLETYE